MSLKVQRRRRRLSMTSLIDVIFLLLLFFMLSSTFSRFAEVELQAGGTGGSPQDQTERVLFLRISADGLTLNGRPVAPADLAAALSAEDGPANLLVSVTEGATAQALADVLVALRPLPQLGVTVLESS